MFASVKAPSVGPSSKKVICPEMSTGAEVTVDDTRLWLVAPWPVHGGFDVVVDGDATTRATETIRRLTRRPR